MAGRCEEVGPLSKMGDSVIWFSSPSKSWGTSTKFEPQIVAYAGLIRQSQILEQINPLSVGLIEEQCKRVA
jgi:hypothetical protein